MSGEGYDVFIAYPGPRKADAVELRKALAPALGAFLDELDLVPGDPWDTVIDEAMKASRVTAVLVAGPDPSTWYNKEEVARAISLARTTTHRVIPIYLEDRMDPHALPYGLARLKGIDWKSPAQVAKALAAAVDGRVVYEPPPADLETLLEAAHDKRDAQLDASRDTAEVEAEILRLQREQRRGGKLHPNVILGGKYKLVELVGSGGYASVWRARVRRAARERYVAVKVLHPEHGAGGLARFERGVRAMQELQDTGGVIPLVEGPCECDGWHYFVMQYAAGRDLHRALLSEHLEEAAALEALFQVADTLSVAHDARIWHRDVKPHNVLLDGDRVFLADFDLVRMPHSLGQSRSSMAVGAWPYAAPEAMVDSNATEGPADQYSLAMCFAFVLHGRLLPRDLLMYRREQFFAGFAAGLRHVLDRATAFSPTDRYPSVAEFAEAMRAALTEGGDALGSTKTPPPTPAQVALLHALDAGPTGVDELAERLDLDSSAVEAVLAELQTAGLIAPVRVRQRRKMQRLHQLTDLGVEVVDSSPAPKSPAAADAPEQRAVTEQDSATSVESEEPRTIQSVVATQRSWDTAADALVEHAIAHGSCFSSGEVGATLRLVRPDLDFKYPVLAKHVRGRATRELRSRNARFVRVERISTGYGRTPPDKTIFVYGPDERGAREHAFEVDIPRGGERVEGVPERSESMQALLRAVGRVKLPEPSPVVAVYEFRPSQPGKELLGLTGKGSVTRAGDRVELSTPPPHRHIALGLTRVDEEPATACRPPMLVIPGGTFMMGSPEGVGHDRERPQHEVTLSPFHMATTPITQAQYRALMGRNPSHFDEKTGGGPNHPVEQVSWRDAVAYCNALSKEEGLAPAYDGKHELILGADGYRLPTEAEWEYACRAGTTTRWWCGDDEKTLREVAWFGEGLEGTTHPVASKQRPNPWGVHDMHGNVWERVHDWRGQYPAAPQTDPTGPPGGDRRVFRGGSYWSGADWCRSAFRDWRHPGFRFRLHGFRVVRPAPRARR